MSDLGDAPAPNQPATDAADSQTEFPLWMVLGAVVVALVLVGAFAFVLTHDEPVSAAPPNPYPDRWDSRVAPYAKIAQKQRSLKFQHPVTVRFLAPDEFEKDVVSDKDELDQDDREEIEQAAGLMRAFGLITGDVDLFEEFNESRGAGVLAYYSFKDERITVRGQKVTPAVRSTLVHELTHVLQDQHFKVGDRMKALREQSEEGETTQASSVLSSIIEGDAERVVRLYRASLTAKQRKALDDAVQGQYDEASPRLNRIPKVIITMMSSPYVLGEGLVQAAAAEGGNKAVDRLFNDSPTHESSLLDPLGVLAGDLGSKTVEPPKLDDDEKKFDSGELGVLTWYFTLAERLPLRDALAAADGWGGDAYIGFERDGNTCARINFAGDSDLDTKRMLSALRRWVAAAPGSPAEVRLARGLVAFESCDPGTAADVGRDASQQAMALLTTRAQLGIGMMRSGVSHELARCLAERFAVSFSVTQLVDPEFAANDPAVQARIRRMALGCR